MAGGGLNLMLRALTLGFRFGLSFYIVAFLGLEAAGIYGLAAGAVGVAPAAIGWGLNYFTAREVVGRTPDKVVALVKSRLFVTLVSLTLGSLGLAAFGLATGNFTDPIFLLILVLLWLETIALDLYLPLIGLELATQANVIVFVRSAVWVPVIIVLGIYVPALRTLEALFVAWIVCHLLSLVLMGFFLRRWPVMAELNAPIDRNWIAARLRQSWYIYFSDLGIVGLAFLDRYIVNWILGIGATGVYTFYWSIANALQTMMQTAVVQLALPRLLKSFREPTLDNWQRALRGEIVKTGILATSLAAAIFVAVEIVIRFDPGGRFPHYTGLLALMMIAAVARAGSDLLNTTITSTGRDRYYAITNVAGVAMTLGFGIFFISEFGLIGSGLSALVTATLLVIARAAYVRRVYRLEVAQRQAATAK
ncbi:hypothetical protein COC42_16590 [Sphingomonas spermidinifaciens]|uniref:Uncharacterized protein n=2 Tax=Sphingomonas spermidinifaciens TaxID=1141889 RepID=A0A2A4B1Q8_9SPHN|nr:hypothetical protein COC42_16590 [Sphingomonas spermidinifaciens]